MWADYLHFQGYILISDTNPAHIHTSTSHGEFKTQSAQTSALCAISRHFVRAVVQRQHSDSFSRMPRFHFWREQNNIQSSVSSDLIGRMPS